MNPPRYALAIHGGAGAFQGRGLTRARAAQYRSGLEAALAAGQHILAGGGGALDAVEAAVVTLEDDPVFNAGRGAVLTIDGSVELDAAIMDGSELRAGAVALVRRTRNPIRLARYVLERLPHVFLAGDGADACAVEAGLPLEAESYFITPARVRELAAVKRRGTAAGSTGTVGAVARDRNGRLAAATSTGGTTGKRSGRIGDSPVIGAGTYADDQSCAVSMTGHGEWFLRTVQAHAIAARLRYGAAALTAAAEAAVADLARLGAQGGLIALDAAGEIVMRHNTGAMLRAAVRDGEDARIDLD